MTTLVRATSASPGFVDLEILPEREAVDEKTKGLFVQDSDHVKQVDDLAISFPTTAKSIPIATIVRLLELYKPRVLTILCDARDRSARSFTLDLTEKGLHLTTYSTEETVTKSCTQQLELSAFALATKELWLGGHWVSLITLTEAVKKIAKPIIQYVATECEWRHTMIQIDLTQLHTSA